MTDAITVSDQEWTLLTADFTHNISHNLFLYVKGPTVDGEVGAEYYIDDFSLVTQGSPAVDFENSGDIVDIGAYEYVDNSMTINDIYDFEHEAIYLYPNPSKDIVTIKNIPFNNRIYIIDISGKKYNDTNIHIRENNSVNLDISKLNTGLYFIRVENLNNGKLKTLRLIKH